MAPSHPDRADAPVGLTRLLVIVFTVSLLLRLPFILGWPFSGGDWEIYQTVAENILRGCGVSLSPPGSGECVPHFGGNHLPGYPAFVALIWWLSNHSDMAIRIAQATLFSLALVRLVQAAAQWRSSLRLAMAIGLLGALSPLQVAWPRYTQTETLALATHIWTLAEIMMSFHERRLRILPLAAALVAAVYVRMDGFLLAVPIAVAGFMIHRPMDAIRRGTVLGLLCVLPIGGWLVRNHLVGLPYVWPEGMVAPNNARAPVGYLAWGNTWVAEEYQRMGWIWPVTRFVYSGISIDERAFDSPEEKEYVASLLYRLRAHEGAEFPRDIDDAFASLARARTAEHPMRSYLVMPLRRALALWSNPFSSFGWPNELPGDIGHQARLEFARSGPIGLLHLAARYPFEAATKALTGAYRFAINGAALVALLLAIGMRGIPARWHIKDEGLRYALWLAGSFCLARTALLALTNNIETRYTVEAVPFIELVVILFLHHILLQRKPV